MPALTISSLNFAIAPSNSSDGILPASESLFALTITMKRMGCASWLVGAKSGLVVACHQANSLRGCGLGAPEAVETRSDVGIEDLRRHATHGSRPVAVGRGVQHCEHGQRNRRKHKEARL